MSKQKLAIDMPEDEGRKLLEEILSTPGYTINLESVRVCIDEENKTVTFQPMSGPALNQQDSNKEK